MSASRFPLLRAVIPWVVALLLWLFMYRLLGFADLATDSRAYWLTGRVDELYRTGPATKDAFLYSPAFAQVIAPLTRLSEWSFYLVWIAAEAAVLVWLLRPLRLPWALCAAALCVPEFIIGNIYVFMAGALAVGFRWPAAWSFLVLTKITPGVGALYFLFTRQWRKWWVAVGFTAAAAGVSFAFSSHDWVGWFRFLVSFSSPTGTLWLQLPLAVALVVLAARRKDPSIAVWAILVSAPVMTTPAVVAILAAIPRLRSSRAARGTPEQTGSAKGTVHQAR